MQAPKRSSYRTVEEMRRDPSRIEAPERWSATGGTRFERSTEPSLALKYFAKDRPVLECGPLYGAFLQFLLEQGYREVHGLDVVNVLACPGKERIAFHEVDFNMERLPYADGFFQGVAAWGIGEHLENPFHFVREVRRVLRPRDGIFIFSIPNVFHIVSRLMFLKKGMFPSWNETNNHISVLPRGVFEKTVLRYFDLVEIRYLKPRLRYLFLDRFSKWLPANEWFGDYIAYVLRPRPEP